MALIQDTGWVNFTTAVGNITAGRSDCAGNPTYCNWASPSSALESANAATTCLWATVFNANFLRVTNLVTKVPNIARIVGIEVRIHKNAVTSNNSGAKDCHVYLVHEGVHVGDDKKQAGEWRLINDYVTHGGPEDNWGIQTWRPSEVNSDNFGVQIQASWNGPIGSSYGIVKHIQMKFYYDTNSMFLQI